MKEVRIEGRKEGGREGGKEEKWGREGERGRKGVGKGLLLCGQG